MRKDARMHVNLTSDVSYVYWQNINCWNYNIPRKYEYYKVVFLLQIVKVLRTLRMVMMMVIILTIILSFIYLEFDRLFASWCPDTLFLNNE